MTALAFCADKSSPDCLDSAIKLIHSCDVKLDVFFVLLKKKKKACVYALLAYKILTGSVKGFLMQHYAFDLLENVTGKGVNVAHLQSLSLSNVVQYETY